MTELFDRIQNDFTYHKPRTEEQIKKHEHVRETLKHAAIEIAKSTPVSREQSLALTNLETAMFWANAALARNQ